MDRQRERGVNREMWTDRGREGGIERCGQTEGERGRGRWVQRD